MSFIQNQFFPADRPVVSVYIKRSKTSSFLYFYLYILGSSFIKSSTVVLAVVFSDSVLSLVSLC